ncbi:DedA family protein [Gordonia westfalica]|uniref:DedA family protein n=1 Tax=Gordonia westfalica TaxID=158898 RepID=A0ABU2GR72_9ACTN|nr:DedA family protein [Gordonia westfalica]MDS1113961.1 DedA family protein [Gordonia westfalica]
MNPFDVESFVATGGLIGLCVLVFVETGLLVGVIFPGDSLLFTAGVFAAQPDPFAPLWLVVPLVALAAIAGDQCGYFIGRRLGRGVVEGRMMRSIGPDYVARTNAFFDRFGPLTVFFGRFIGIVRTLVPLTAGFSGMSHRVFTLFSVLGSLAWAGGIIVAGYLLGNVPIVRDNIEILIIASVLTVVVPMFVHVARRWRAMRRRQRGVVRVETPRDDQTPPETG